MSPELLRSTFAHRQQILDAFGFQPQAGFVDGDDLRLVMGLVMGLVLARHIEEVANVISMSVRCRDDVHPRQRLKSRGAGRVAG